MELLKKIEAIYSSKIESYREPKPMNLYFSYYHDSNEERRNEIQLAIRLNAKNKLFQHLYIINETNIPLDFIEESESIHIVHEPTRFRFSDFFRFSNEQTKGNTDTINVLINSDIIVGEMFDQLTLESNQVLCLTRHEIMDEYQASIVHGGGTCDAWIWKGVMMETLGDFYMGKFFCDGRIANQFCENGFLLKNPALDLKIYHLHISNVRNYNPYHQQDCVMGNRTGVKITHWDGIFSKEDIYHDGFYGYV